MFKIKKIKPMYTGIVCTANRYTEDQTAGGVILDAKKTEGYLKEYQTVLAIGSSVREVKVGDTVLINPTRFLVKSKLSAENSLRNEFVEPEYHLEIPQAEMDGASVLTIEERDVAYIIEGEEVPDPAPNAIIMPKKPKLKK